MLPTIYTSAAVRNVTPVCPVRRRLGLGIDMPDGSVLRVALDEASVALLRAALDDYFTGLDRPAFFNTAAALAAHQESANA